MRNVAIDEVNTAYACILFKGHNKDKSSSNSYRTISTCPVVAKALDLHIRDLHLASWNLRQMSTQYQGEGSSHELAALLLTECIQHSLHQLKLPLYALYLDAKSAFDVVQRELLVRNLFFSQDPDQSILLLDARLANRKTVLDWNGHLMGPICDEQGLEQGGVNSSDLYKIYGREQLKLAEDSRLGVKLGNLVISGIGQADDTVLVSNDLHNLSYLLELNSVFNRKALVAISQEKTKLQVFRAKAKRVTLSENNHIKINEKIIPFSPVAEHVGVLRSTEGNHPTILSRYSAHKRALASLLHTGISRGHRGNPASSVRIEKMYALPVLLSGIATLVLSNKDIDLIDAHLRETLRNLQRLHDKTPRAVVHFLAGCLPGAALVHLRQMSIFGMVCRLKDNVLNKHAINLFSFSIISSGSWFHQIRQWCLLYGLPHPSTLLANPLSKPAFKRLVKSKITDYWEVKLRQEVASLQSLTYFTPSYMSLSSAHPVWTTAGYSPAKVAMATIQAIMISGRYRCDSLVSHWSSKVSGYCSLSPACHSTREDLRHILQVCPALHETRLRLYDHTMKASSAMIPRVREILLCNCDPNEMIFPKFLLDCSSLPAVQNEGPDVLIQLFSVTRVWVYVLHRERLKLRGRWRR